VNHLQLLDRIYHFYPRGLSPDSPGYDGTVERSRQVAATRSAIAEYPTWKAMLDRLRACFPIQERSLHVISGTYDSAYSAEIGTPRENQRALGFHVSLLGPYYVVHDNGIPEEQPWVQAVTREIEATYGGYQAIPPEIGMMTVPDVALDSVAMGRATIYDCLLSHVWGRDEPE
jgi:hypothetical protein